MPEVRIADLVRRGGRGDRRRGAVDVSTRRRGTAADADARGSATAPRPISATWFNQPWLERPAAAGNAGAAARAPGRVRLRRPQLRHRRRRRRPRTSLRSTRRARRSPAKKLRELVGAALPRVRLAGPAARPSSKSARRCPRASMRSGRCTGPRSLDEAEAGRRRLAFDELLAAPARARAPRGASASRGRAGARPPGELVARYRDVLPFAADRAPGARDRRDRRRPRAHACRCSGCCRATSAPARRSSRSTRCCARSRRDGRAR